MHNKTYLFILLAFCLFGTALAVGFFYPNWMQKGHMANPATEQVGPVVLPDMPEPLFNAFAQDFSVVRGATERMELPDVDILAPGGKPVRISSFSGLPTLVNMWATWCAPCVVELPSLQKFAEHYQGRMNVIAISLDPMKKQEDIAAFLENRGVSDFAGYFDASGAFGAALGLRGIPTSFLIGKNGQILYRFEGDADWTTPAAQEFFDFILKEANSQTGE